MDRLRSETAARSVFVASLMFGAFLYGFVAESFGLFPAAHLNNALRQFRQVRKAIWSADHPATEPRVYRREGAWSDDATKKNGLFLIPSVWADFGWRPGLKLIDRRGEVLHEWEVDPQDIFPDRFEDPLIGSNEFNHPTGSQVLPGGDVLVVLPRIGTVRMDGCSRVKWRIRGNHHHSMSRVVDGTFWISGSKRERTQDPITGVDSVRHDLLIQLSVGGEILERISVFEILEENDSLLRRHLRFRPDDTHLNDVEPLQASMADEYPLFEAGDLLVSLKHLNLVFVVDPETLEVSWWTGEPFIQQHDPDFLGDGWIGVFDNREDGTRRGTRLGGSRVVRLKPDTDSTVVWFESSSGTRVYTKNRGNWQRLPDGNLLMTESNTGRVVEVNPEGEFVWKWVQSPYRKNRVPRVYWAEWYALTPTRVSSWPCSPGESDGDPEQ